MKRENTNCLANNISDRRFGKIAEATLRRSQLRITVDVNNFLDQPVTCIKSNRVIHIVDSETNFDIGRALVIKFTVQVKHGLVKINADEDYNEEFLPEFFTRYKSHCQHRVIAEDRGFNAGMDYTAWMVFDAKKLFALDNRIIIPEVGLTIRVGRHTREVKGTQETLRDELKPPLIPGNDKRASGFVVNAVDPQHKFDRMFYRVGKDIFEVDIDRDPNQEPGIFIGMWNRLNGLDDAVRQDIVKISLDDAASGNNPSGIQMYPSILEAILGKTEPVKKDSDKDKKAESTWEKKDQQAKVSHTWVKVAADFLKNVLPATVTIVKGMIKLVGKLKGLPT